MVFESVEGCRLKDVNGFEYIDIAGITVAHLGHGRKDIAQVAYEQMQKLEVANQRNMTNVNAIKLCEKLPQLANSAFPEHFGDSSRVFLTVGGAEGIEAGMAVAHLLSWLDR